MRGIGFLLAASAALAASVVAQATGIPKPMVNDEVVTGKGFPRTLGEFGFFQDYGAREPSDFVHPYELNTPLFSDGAEKLRYIYVPEGAQMNADGEGLLKFPVGSAIIKTFAFGEGDEQRFIETRVLLHRSDGWLALPYRWNEEQTEAKLALAGGRVPLTTPSGEEISYRIPNKNQCKACHSVDGEVIPIGPKARNLSGEWLASMHKQGWLDQVAEGADTLPLWSDPSASTDARARAYLDLNCAHCHRPGGGASNSGLDLSWEQQDAFAIGINKPPVAAGRGAGGLLVSIEPGKPEKSILVHRMNSNEPGVAMPELGRSTVDKEAVTLIRDWIAQMDQGTE
ncbi:SO2930 family diheme c-type cytochrome [uncultured Erythrobacter sp.]|uniref:SO2930 family diheme c-type cytochrome n=1 Tax=uncultured Erythrobacter sp. TaxID=263913 RepID=UPI00262A5136|nr:SO2930 family diheme c-type cytochrome [uncultured Erythrobacter sp.]